MKPVFRKIMFVLSTAVTACGAPMGDADAVDDEVIAGDVGTDAAELRHAQRTHQNSFDSVGVFWRPGQAQFTTADSCTGVLITPNAVVTTARCAQMRQKLRFSTDASFNRHWRADRSRTANVSHVQIHPEWAMTRNPEHDIAVAFLEHDIVTADIATLPGESTKDEDLVSATVVGYGDHGRFLWRHLRGIRHAGNAQLTGENANMYLVDGGDGVRFCHNDGGAALFSLAARGDGRLDMRHQGTLIGIMTGVVEGDRDARRTHHCAATGRFVRVDSHLPWLNQVVGLKPQA